GNTLLAQPDARLFDDDVGFGPRALAVHPPRAGLLAQFSDQSRIHIRSRIFLSTVQASLGFGRPGHAGAGAPSNAELSAGAAVASRPLARSSAICRPSSTASAMA